MIVALALVFPWVIAFSSNRYLEIFVAAHARRFGLRRDVRRELWRDRDLIIAHSILAFGAYPGLFGVFFHADLGDAQYIFYVISMIWVLVAVFNQIRVMLNIMKRHAFEGAALAEQRKAAKMSKRL